MFNDFYCLVPFHCWSRDCTEASDDRMKTAPLYSRAERKLALNWAGSYVWFPKTRNFSKKSGMFMEMWIKIKLEIEDEPGFEPSNFGFGISLPVLGHQGLPLYINFTHVQVWTFNLNIIQAQISLEANSLITTYTHYASASHNQYLSYTDSFSGPE
jgi:hypothetical protein